MPKGVSCAIDRVSSCWGCFFARIDACSFSQLLNFDDPSYSSTLILACESFAPMFLTDWVW